MTTQHFDAAVDRYSAPAARAATTRKDWLEAVWAPRVLSIVRIMSALIFMAHGTQKLLNFPPMAPGRSNPELLSMLGVAGTLELFGGALLVLGLFTRPVAFVLSGLGAAAYFIGHAPRGFFPVNNGGDSAILYCFIFFYFVFAGGGTWSLDRLIWKKD